MIQIILSSIAIVISLCAAGSQFLQWYLEGRRVSVTAEGALMAGTPDAPGMRSVLVLSATNHGRIPAVIRQWGFYNPHKVYSAGPGPGAWSKGPDMPFALEPGATQAWFLDSREQQQLLAAYHPDSPYLLRGFVRLGTGKRRLSSSFVQVGTGATRLTNPPKWRLRRTQVAAGPGVLVVGKLGSDHFDLTLQRPKLCLYIKRFVIDVVIVDPTASTEAEVLPGSSHAYRFWFRRKIVIAIRDKLLDMPHAWYRIRWRARGQAHERKYSEFV